MRYLTSSLLAILALASIGAIHAQARPESGARVRVTSPQLREERTVGILDRFTDDTVVVAGQAISRASIRRFEVSEGRKSQAGAGMRIGLLGGALVGAGLCALRVGYSLEDGSMICAPRALLLSLGGLLVGGIAGASVPPGERWRVVSLGTLRIAPTLRLDGTLGLSIGIRF